MHPTFADTPTFRFFKTSLKDFRWSYSGIEYLYSLHNWDALNYITIDHKVNKARCPQKMFDFDNLQAVCWRCNWEKSDDNTYDSRYTRVCLKSLVEETLSRYQ